MLRRLDQLEGKWQLTRSIMDRRNGMNGQLSGMAVFTNTAPHELTYVEEGELHYGQQPAMTAKRQYIWRAVEAGGVQKIAVHFEDGSPFHSIALDRSMPDDDHLCDPDYYFVSYDFSHWPKWQAEWKVLGPSKDYRMISRYTPVAQAR